MTLAETLIAVWQQVLAEAKLEVELNGERYHVAKTRSGKLRAVRFKYGEYDFDGIEQNPDTASSWAALAREGNRIMQFSFHRRLPSSAAIHESRKGLHEV